MNSIAVDAMRLLLLSLGLLAGYVIGAIFVWRGGRHLASSFRIALALCVAFTLVVGMYSIEKTIAWAVFWNEDWFEYFPFDAILAGFAVGFILADRRRRPGHQTSDASSNAPPVLPAIMLTAACVTLLVLGVMRPRQWSELLTRAQSVSASPTSGVSVSFSNADTRNASRAVRAAAGPAIQPRGKYVNEIGFAAPRLETLLSLVSSPAVQEPNGEALSTLRMLEDASATRVILSEPDTRRRPRLGSQTHFIARDRGIFWMMRNRGGPEVDDEFRKQVRSYASKHERTLIALHDHVACLAHLVRTTGDQKIIEYRNYSIVEHITVIARDLMTLERNSALRSLESNSPGIDLSKETGMRVNIQKRTDVLKDSLRAFVVFSKDFVRLKADGERGCEQEYPLIPDIVDAWEPCKSEQGFYTCIAPYTQIFAAYLLSAIGDHFAATQMLVEWLEGLDQIENNVSAEKRPVYQRMLAWLRLRVVTELYFLQKVSERAEAPVTPRPELAKYIVFEAFPAVLDDHVRAQWMKLPSRGKTLACRAPDEEWRQPIVLAYFAFVKEYLDLMLSNDAPSEKMNVADVQLAERLIDLDLGCFPAPLKLPTWRADQRAEFASTFALVVSTWAQSRKGQEAPARLDELKRKAKLEITVAIGDLDRVGATRIAESRPYRQLVYGASSKNVRDAATRAKESLED